jgi:hypothetical protein
MEMTRVLLIGINYVGSPVRLRGCVEDISNMCDFLKKSGKSYDIRILADENIVGEKCILPTKENIIKNIEWLTESDTDVIFYFSGHGANIVDKEKDEKDGMDEVLVPVDYTSNGVITDDYVYNNLVLKIKKGKKLWAFVDACRSGSIFDLGHSMAFIKNSGRGVGDVGNAIMDRKRRKRRAKKDESNGKEDLDFIYSSESNFKTGSSGPQGKINVFSGCMDSQTSADATINNINRGAFSYCLFESLRDPLFRNKTLLNILKEINNELKEKNFEQTSQLSVSEFSNFTDLFDF